MITKYALAIALFVLAVATAPAGAQQDMGRASPIELYAGYDYIRFNINASPTVLQPPSETFNANGGGGQFVYNVNNWLGVLGDVSGYWATNSIKSGAAMPYLFGPRANLHRGKITPFAQVIVGGILTSGGIQTFGWQNHFAMAVGGGLDVRVSRHISLRPLEAEYFLTKIPDGLNNRQNNFRAGAGIAFRFG
jgi:opacity protein-like surface antigen